MGDPALRRQRLPGWIRSKRTHLGTEREMKQLLRNQKIQTICEEARCPNRSECFGNGTATFLILGETCTRNCGFCGVTHGVQGTIPHAEIEGVVRAVKSLKLTFVVLTVVTRDDLPDGGASHMASCIEALKEQIPGVKVEILSSDLKGRREDITTVISSGPDVFAHNLETVERLTPEVRRGASYRRSLDVLKTARSIKPGIILKSGIMVGLGEQEEEILQTLKDLRTVSCDVVTIGQYLQPDRNCLEVKYYWPPVAFDAWKLKAEEMGFRKVFSAPFVRSSYRAHEVFD